MMLETEEAREDLNENPDECDLEIALLAVSNKMLHARWSNMSKFMRTAMTACVKNMPRTGGLVKNEKVITFAKECMFRMVDVIVGLKDEGFEKSNQCLLYEGLISDIVRIIIRIGHVSTAAELKNWNNFQHAKTWQKTWIQSLVLVMDCKQPAYWSKHHDQHTNSLPNSLWTCCLATFFEEGGFALLSTLLDSKVFEEPSQVAEQGYTLHCQIALLIKRLVTRELVVIGASHMPTAEEVGFTMKAVEVVTDGAMCWLLSKLNDPERKFVWQQRNKHDKRVELMTSILELFGNEEALSMTQDLLSNKSLKVQQTGVLLIQGLGDEHMKVEVYREYVNQLKTMLSGSQDNLVLQLENLGAESFVFMFQSLMKIATKNNEDELTNFWGDIALRCICTSKHSSRSIGFGLIDVLKRNRLLKNRLAPAASAALAWMVKICGQSAYFDIATSLEHHDLMDWGQFKQLFLCVENLLRFTDNDADIIANVWLDTSIRCLQCIDHHSVREFGLLVFQNGIDLTDIMYKTTALRGLLRTLASTKQYITPFLESLFSEQYANSALIIRASSWLVNVYYKGYCYDVSNVEIMSFLVEAAVHPDWGVVEPVTELIVTISIENISIRSLNSFCELIKEAISDEAISEVAHRVICTWLARTAHKNWVVVVQACLLDLLWTVLMTTSVESTDVSGTVLEYFKKQFRYIKDSVWSGVVSDYSDNAIIAKHCIIICAAQCFAEIERCRDSFKQSHSNPNLPVSSQSSVHDGVLTDKNRSTIQLRSRATQAASLLDLIISVVDHLRPDILRVIIHHGPPSEMVQILLEETLQSARFNDVHPNFVVIRLQLIANISSGLNDSLPLTFDMVKVLWDCFFGVQSISRNLNRHRQVFLQWFQRILKPKETASDLHYFRPSSLNLCKRNVDAEAVVVLEDLGKMMTTSETKSKLDLNEESIDCFLYLFFEVNTGNGVLEETKILTSAKKIMNLHFPSFVLKHPLDGQNQMQPFPSKEILHKPQVLCFDLLTELALDGEYTSATCHSLFHSLLRVCFACYDAQRGCFNRGGDANAWKNCDLLYIIFSRINALQNDVSARIDPKFTVSEVNRVKHWFTLLFLYFEKMSIYNSRSVHEACFEGEEMTLSVRLYENEPPKEEENESMNQLVAFKVVLHENMIISEVLSNSIEVMKKNKVACEGNYVLYHQTTCLNESHRTLKSYGIVNGETLKLMLTVLKVETPLLEHKFLSPSEQFSNSEEYTRTTFKLLECKELCDYAWCLLRMVPSATSEYALIHDRASKPKWSSIVGVSDANNRGLWQRVYSCQMMEKMLIGAYHLWIRDFVSDGGLSALLSMLDGEDLAMITSPYLRRAILIPLKMVNLCISSCFQESLLSCKNVKTLTHKSHLLTVEIKNILIFMFGVTTIIHDGEGLKESEIDTFSQLCVTKMTMLILKLNPETWLEINSKFPFKILVHLLIESPSKLLRQEIKTMFRVLLSLKKTYHLYDVLNLNESISTLPAIEVFGDYFFEKCLRNISNDSNTAYDFFVICHKLLDEEHIRWLKPCHLRLFVEEKLKSFSVTEDSTAVVSDTVLTGVLALLSRLHALDPPSSHESHELVPVLLNSFLRKLQRTSE